MLEEMFQKVNTGTDKDKDLEIPGFETMKDILDKSWKMRFAIFDLNDSRDIEAIEDIYTRASNLTKGNKSGVKIFHEVGRFFEDGSFKTMVRWGEWEDKERKA